MSAPSEVTGMPATAAGTAVLRNVLQVAAVMQIALIAGATFGIWRGLGAAQFSAATFIDVHQELVRGLNVLLPAMGAAFAVLMAALAWLARSRRPALYFYLAALALGIAAGLLTRFWNQPINAQVMEWTVQTIPADWTAIRDSWWRGHVIRTFISIAALVATVLALKTDVPAKR
ncbi:MAG: anthrone oxygenase family protein [Oricola sp.]